MEALKWIAVTGNPVDGFFFYGPFPSPEAATEWGEREGQTDWWITELAPPAPQQECLHIPVQKLGEIICELCGEVLR